MIKQRKDPKIPESLKNTQSYDGEDVKKQLLVDQYGKCYLCERILTTDFEIEHIKSKKHFPESIREWDNLLLSCRYCNGKKLDDYDDIDNPWNVQVENSIRQELDFKNKIAVFTNLTTNNSTDKTIQLLNIIYNGTSRCRKIKEERFFEHIVSTVNDFSKIILDYLNDPNELNENAVKEELSIAKEALGFKYWVIKLNPQLEKKFASDIVWNK